MLEKTQKQSLEQKTTTSSRRQPSAKKKAQKKPAANTRAVTPPASQKKAKKQVEPKQSRSAASNALVQEEKRDRKKRKKKGRLTADELHSLNTKKGLLKLLGKKKINIKKTLVKLKYEQELEKLQIEMVRLQREVQLSGRRIAILFEGRDAAAKGGTIRRFIEHLNPRTARVVALNKPSEVEQGQWYFQRYSNQLPNRGEITFFDRSWYNRAVVEPVMGFCTKAQHKVFMQQVPEFEHMLYEDGIELIKFWFSISKETQAERFQARRSDPLKQWKISPVDERAQEKWDVYTKYKEEMFSKTHTSYSPWTIVKANDKKKARLESMRYVLSQLPYPDKDQAVTSLSPDPEVVLRYHRSSHSLD